MKRFFHGAHPAAAFYALVMLAFAFCLALPAQAAVKVQEVKSPAGVTAWLVEDHSVPIVTIRFAFEGGSTQDPVGKEGLANVMSGLFDEGAGDLDSEAFQIRLDDAGAEMSFDDGRDDFYGTMRMLSEEKAEALELLRLAITAPRFDAGPVARIKSQIIAGIQSNARDPQTEAQRRWLKALYGDHPYSRDSTGTEASVNAVGADDLHAFHRALFARDTLHVAVVGDIDAQTLKGDLDRLFGALPAKADLKPVADTEPKLAQTVRYEYPLPQTTLQLAYPGLKRSDPDFFAAVVMNQVLGGGDFTSHLFKEVREKRGLTYGVSSGIANYEHADALVISTSTRAGKGDETLGIIRDVVKDMADNGPTQQEIDEARKYLVGAYPINNLNSSGAIASTILELQIDDLGIDYMERRESYFAAVTLDQVKAVAKRLLQADPAVLILGPAAPAQQPG